MHRLNPFKPSPLSLLLCVAVACSEPPRPAGKLTTQAGLFGGAQAGTPLGQSAIVLRSQPLRFLSAPYQAGSAVQEGTLDGLVVQPAFVDAHPAAFVTTEVWDGFPRVWAQPIYLLVTGFDPIKGPTLIANASPIFGVAPGSRFYSPYWQTYYVTIPAGFKEDSLHSGEAVLASGLTLTLGPLRFCSIGSKDLKLEVAHVAGSPPVHPFTQDPLTPRIATQGWAEDELVWFVDFGLDRFRISSSLVVQEAALFRLAVLAPDGTQTLLELPPVGGTGAFGAPRAPDAPNGIPRFGALWHEYIATITPREGLPLPGIFITQSTPDLRARIIAQAGAAYVPVPSALAEALPERFQYQLRVAADGGCFQLTDFPNSCVWLDTQGSIEANLPPTAFTDTKRFSAGALLLFDGIAP